MVLITAALGLSRVPLTMDWSLKLQQSPELRAYLQAAQQHQELRTAVGGLLDQQQVTWSALRHVQQLATGRCAPERSGCKALAARAMCPDSCACCADLQLQLPPLDAVLRRSSLVLPTPPARVKSPELQARLAKLQRQLDQREYERMTADVTVQARIDAQRRLCLQAQGSQCAAAGEAGEG